MQIHFLNYENKSDMAQNSTQITGIAFSELKAERKQLGTENYGKMLFCQNFNRYRTSHIGEFQGPLEEEGVEVGTFKMPSQDKL